MVETSVRKVSSTRSIRDKKVYLQNSFSRAGLSHSDIKPENIFINNVKTYYKFVLGDYGLAFFNSPQDTDIADQTIKQFAHSATLKYLAPERVGLDFTPNELQ